MKEAVLRLLPDSFCGLITTFLVKLLLFSSSFFNNHHCPFSAFLQQGQALCRVRYIVSAAKAARVFLIFVGEPLSSAMTYDRMGVLHLPKRHEEAGNNHVG
ncbi:hypothetical protein [Komagataeibacter diospyri]|uniref:hypothetical protein n=1 Tax=Komagataeibacter diospyri TaxID=1932662 RepID=UPI001144D986|nr:hypothetical protein [Komagataeibacter diospyri]